MAALDGIPHAYWHTWTACSAFESAYGVPVYLYAVEDGDLRAACSFAERSCEGLKDIFTPAGFGGFCGDGSATRLRERWAALVQELGYVCGYFALHPEVAWADAHAGLVQTNDLYVLDLTPGPDALRASVDRSVRRALRDWSTGKASFVTDRARLGQFMSANYNDFMARKEASTRTVFPRAMLESMLDDPGLLMVGVEDAQGICAAHTFARSRFGAECHLNVWVREGRSATAPMLWWGIEQLAGLGMPWLQMGGGLQPGDSIARSKEKFRPHRRPMKVAREIYRPDDYAALCIAAGIDPAADAAFFPPYHAGR